MNSTHIGFSQTSYYTRPHLMTLIHPYLVSTLEFTVYNSIISTLRIAISNDRRKYELLQYGEG